MKNKPLSIYGDGSHTRSFCFVSDMIDAIILMMSTNNEIIGPINLGNTEEKKMISLAKKINKLTNNKSKIKYYPLPPLDDPF